MKKWFSKKSNLFTLILFIFVLIQKAPLLFENMKNEGVVLSSETYEVLNKNIGKDAINFPSPNSKSIAIFWATWCGPCKIEMNRLKSSVENGKIPAGAIIAINPFETKEESRKFIATNAYPFTFIDAPNISQKLNIHATPTTAFFENGKIISISSGMSLFGIWRAEYFL